ncbi:MAG TPA: hypothetical protein PLY32_03395 [Salinivirgaceae bacterium]|nr:hypothetical protein [Salinivirgaceae bacterium]HPW67031.1 hypothetical protein [Salinivirgaceae bacterium]HQA76144.1 hypothetical protein [Salinivirgaceae bacterium]
MKIIIAFFLTLWCIGLSAQGFNMRNKEVSFSFGFLNYDVKRLPENENLDFLNYEDTYPGIPDDAVVKFGFSFDFFERMSFDIKAVLMSDLAPNCYDISTHYSLNKMFSIGLGSQLYKLYITGFEQFHIQNFPDYHLMSENVQQFETHDLGFYLSPVVKLVENERFKMRFDFNVGLATFLKESTGFQHKRKLSNERLVYTYNTKISYQPFFNPKFDMSLRAFKIKGTSVGFLLNSNYLIGRRSMNYKRTIQRWTADNETSEDIKLKKRRYTRFEANIGLYVKW